MSTEPDLIPGTLAFNPFAHLQAHEATLAMRMLADSSVIGIFKTQGRCFVWTNSACNRMLGYADGELIGQPTRQLYPDDRTYEALGQQLYASAGTGELAVTAAFKRKDGRLGWYVLHARRLNEATDELIGLFVDVSHIKELEETLRQSNDHLEMALTSSGTGTWTYDFKKDKFNFDFRTAAIVGIETDQPEFSMAGWLSMIHPEDLPEVQTTLASHMSGNSPYLVLDYRIRHQKEGHWIAVVSHGKVSWNQAGEHAFAAGILQDVSEIKRLREEGTDLLRKIESLLRDFSDRSEVGRKSAMRHVPLNANEPSLSKRHREILKLIATGLTSMQIAERLNISHATVLTHRRNLLRKLNLHSIAGLTRYAIEHQIISPQALG